MCSTRTARRSIGRPRPVAGVALRELLLDAALTLFGEQGIAGTTLAEIASRAGVTPAMVHYYFKNRNRLLDAIARERLLPILTSVWSPVLESTEVVPMLRGLVQRIFKATEVNAWLPSLWLREIASEGGQLRTRLFKLAFFDYVRHLISTVTAAQRRGEINPELEPRLVLISVIGNTLLPLATVGMWQQLPAVLQGVTREQIARHAEALLVSAFSKNLGSARGR
ncbi:MAG TPA: TetR/AcrR family transcriptional regulator [Steroidobacteraceae bacterium]|nr:TetR/AcrR family transcriptional regulator [Steroidobacteraceae bacterium]